MLYFCTYFDSNYLTRGLALYKSLVRHAMPFRLWVLCFDGLTYEILQKLELPQVNPISLAAFEYGDEQLLQAKRNRSRVEYYFTCTPSLLLYILRNCAEVDVITYVDADLFFFSDPSPIYKELGDNSVLIVENRFSPHISYQEVYGTYNGGFLSFRRNDMALRCLQWWRNRCLEWCYCRAEDQRFADQKYLDNWPTRFDRVVVLQHKGAGLAPWNAANYCLRVNKGQVVVDSQPLIFFHFSFTFFFHFSFKQIGRRLRRCLHDPRSTPLRADSLLKQYIYDPYLRELQEVAHRLSPIVDQSYIKMSLIQGSLQAGVKRNLFYRTIEKILLIIKTLLRGQRLVVMGIPWCADT